MSHTAASRLDDHLRLVTTRGQPQSLIGAIPACWGGFDSPEVRLLASILTTGSEWRRSYLLWSPTNQEGDE